MDRKKIKKIKELDRIINELEMLEYVFSRKGFSNCQFYIKNPLRQVSVDFEVLKPILLDTKKDKLSYYKKILESM